MLDIRANHGASWTREELILAFALYCRIPFRKTKANNPEVAELAKLLKRSPASVARKLGNFGSFDPELHKQEIAGLAHASKLDGEIWAEFSEDWGRLVLEAERLRVSHGAASVPEGQEDDIRFPQGPSEKAAVLTRRVHQAFFRDAVLSSYDGTCCITGLRLAECLVASHIVPWSVSEEHRADPRNGLCLSATFDRLFDRGLITLNMAHEVVVCTKLRRTGDRRINEMICQYHGALVAKPTRFVPASAHIQWHRENVFRG